MDIADWRSHCERADEKCCVSRGHAHKQQKRIFGFRGLFQFCRSGVLVSRHDCSRYDDDLDILACVGNFRIRQSAFGSSGFNTRALIGPVAGQQRGVFARAAPVDFAISQREAP